MPKAIRHTLTWGTVLVLMGCEPERPAFTVADVREVPAHFPAYVEPADNPLNEAKWELGRHLFSPIHAGTADTGDTPARFSPVLRT